MIKYLVRIIDNVIGKESDVYIEADSIRALVQTKRYRELERRYDVLKIEFWERV